MRNADLRSSTPAYTRSSFARTTASDQPLFSFLCDNSMLSALREGEVALASFVDNEYHQLSPAERSRAFEIISCPSFVKKHSAAYPLIKARFNPGNQYRVKTFYKEKENVYDCFRFEGRFHTGAALFLKESYITEVVRLVCPGVV